MTGERKIISTVVKIGSYSGISVLILSLIIEFIGIFFHIDRTFLRTFIFSGIVMLIFTPVLAMFSISLYFVYNRQWSRAITSIFVCILILVTFILIK